MADQDHRELYKAIKQRAHRTVYLDGEAPLTQAQGGAVVAALVAIIEAVPDALYGVKNEKSTPGSWLHRFWWVRGGAFGMLEVTTPPEGDSQPPETKGWIRPLSSIRKIDVEAKVERDRFVASESRVYLGIVIRWPDEESTILDGTVPLAGESNSRPALEELIKKVLDSVGAEVSEAD